MWVCWLHFKKTVGLKTIQKTTDKNDQREKVVSLAHLGLGF